MNPSGGVSAACTRIVEANNSSAENSSKIFFIELDLSIEKIRIYQATKIRKITNIKTIIFVFFVFV